MRTPGSPTGSPTPEAAPIPAGAALYAIGILAIGGLVGSILAGIAAGITGSTTGAVTIGVGEIGLWSGMAGAAVYVTRRFGTGSLRRDLGLGLAWRDVWPGLIAVVAGLIVTNLVGQAFVGTRFNGSNTQIITDQKHHNAAFILITVIVAVGAPFFEELFFRGVLRTALSSRLGSHGAVWAQAALFGLAHYQPGTGAGNISVIVIVGSLGVVLGYTARATRRLGPGMLAHGLYNLVQVIVVLN